MKYRWTFSKEIFPFHWRLRRARDDGGIAGSKEPISGPWHSHSISNVFDWFSPAAQTDVNLVKTVE